MYVNEIKELERGLNLVKPYLTSTEVSDANRTALNQITADGVALHEVLTLAAAESTELDADVLKAAADWVQWVDETVAVVEA